MVCHICGAELKDTDVFCKECGAKQEKRCLHCGMKIRDDARFCNHCGQPVKKEEAVGEHKIAEVSEELSLIPDRSETTREQELKAELYERLIRVLHSYKEQKALVDYVEKKQDKFCIHCGMRIQDDMRFCYHCGQPVKNEEAMVREEGVAENSKKQVLSANSSESMDETFDYYRNNLLEKSKQEKLLLGGVIAISAIAVLAYYGNNGDFLEALMAGALIGGIGYVIYGVVAGNLECYEATKYLKKYDSIKEHAGKKEAILFIERDYKPQEKGLGPMLASMKMTGGCLGGCLQMVVGLAISIIAVILVMAFC